MIINIEVGNNIHIDTYTNTIRVDVDEHELLREIGGTEAILDMLDYSEITEYVTQVENEKREDEEVRRWATT